MRALTPEQQAALDEWLEAHRVAWHPDDAGVATLRALRADEAAARLAYREAERRATAAHADLLEGAPMLALQAAEQRLTDLGVRIHPRYYVAPDAGTDQEG